MAVTANQVQSLYLAYFGRPAEQAGLTYWTSQTNATVDQISAAFAQQPEYTNVYGNLSRVQTIQELYNNLFNRTASDAEISYWNASTDVSVSRMALALVNGATGNDAVNLANKVGIAQVLTVEAGANASAQTLATAGDQTTNGANFGTLYTGSASASASQQAAQASTTALNSFSNQLKFGISGSNVVNGNGATVGASSTGTLGTTTYNAALNFAGATSATLTAVDANAPTVTLPAGNTVTSLTVNGTADGGVTGSTITPLLTFAENTNTGATQQLASLQLNLSNTTTANHLAPTLVNVATSITSLTTIDGSGSSANLGINEVSSGASALTNLTTLNTGSGNDTLVVSTIAPNAQTAVAALTVNSGAGADTITATVGTSALTINSGDGADVLTLSAGAGVLTVNTGAGNDSVTLAATGTVASTVTAAHNEVITLGAGNDTVTFSNVVANIQNFTAVTSSSTAAQLSAADANLKAGMITVSDFSTSTDMLVFTNTAGNGNAANNTVATLTNAQAGAISGQSTLALAVEQAASYLSSSVKAVAFQYGSDTYVFVDNAAGTAAVVNSGDTLIQLSGVTASQLSSANFTHA
ncbi:hypothetical protein RSA46_04635 [Pseudomonas oryzihabitans]|nr:hypothetical protein RSA46_04635 [Pseudomonas psychrotolerans]